MVKKTNSSDEKSFMRGVKWFAILAIVFIVAYLLTPVLTKEFRTAEYGNLTFTKTKFGDIPAYHYSYTFEGLNGKIKRYNLYLRNNPEENSVPVTGEIEYQKMGRTIYSSINESSLIGCTNANRELTTIAMFVIGQDYKFEQSYLDNETAVLRNGKYATCQNKANNMVLEIARTDRTIIEKTSPNCYRLEFKSCEDFLDVVEKFETESLVDAKNRSLYG